MKSFDKKVFLVYGIIIKAPREKPLTLDEIIAASPFPREQTRKIIAYLHSEGLIGEVPA